MRRKVQQGLPGYFYKPDEILKHPASMQPLVVDLNGEWHPESVLSFRFAGNGCVTVRSGNTVLSSSSTVVEKLGKEIFADCKDV